MDIPATHRIPNRFDTLTLLRRLGSPPPLLMLPCAADGYGARWLLDGQQVSPAIAKYLMHEGLLGDVGATELGARKLVLTTAGVQFRERGMRWWSALGPLQKLGVMIRG
jgi:hypothetical protein